ncbi:hypothetical protein Fmac_015146 [Flemingia macrophylla]|uniref:S-protein homolog n=1 Tax=Flemingia macrophylla TaxID=520843 RepID=A0ABD1MEJ6_9FABA
MQFHHGPHEIQEKTGNGCKWPHQPFGVASGDHMHHHSSSSGSCRHCSVYWIHSDPPKSTYPFEVPKNSSKDLNYVVQSSSIPLSPDQMELVDDAWKKNEIQFDFKGAARTQWRVGPLGSVKFLCRLDCDLKFRPLNGTYIPSRCTSKSK